MAIPYYSRKRINPLDRKAEGKYYPAPYYISEIGVDKIASDISKSMSLTKTDVVGVIDALLEEIPQYIMLGYKVRLGSFGIFKASFSSHGQGFEAAAEVTTDGVEKLRVIYTPDIQIKTQLQNPEFVKIDAKFIGGGDSGEAESGPTENEEDAAE